MFFFNSDIKRLQATIEQNNARLHELKQQEAAFNQSFDSIKGDFRSDAAKYFYQRLLQSAQQSALHDAQLPPYQIPGWAPENWSGWQPQKPDIHGSLLFGKMVEQDSNTDYAFTLPVIVDFIGRNISYIIESDNAGSNEVYGFLQSLALRINAKLLHNVNFNFIDESGFGKAFPIARELNTRLNTGDLFRLLEDIGKDITRINQTYGLSDDSMFDSIADSVLINEKFEIIFVANFPKGYDRRVIEKLLKIADQGPIAGKYVFIHHNTDEELPRDISLTPLSNASRIALSDDSFSWTLDSGTSIPLTWSVDEKPSDDITKLVRTKIDGTKGVVKVVDWEAIKPADNWGESAIEYIEAQIGVRGNNTPLNIWFGRKQNEGSRQCIHGVLAGMPGSGKSNFYHALILGLSSKYSPKEISLYLIDGKDGVEFQDYKNLPHAEFVSLKSLPGLSRSILKDLTEEIERRNEMFKEKYSVDNYENFRRKTGNTQLLPRILLIVDEYQELFEGDNLGEASNYLRKISEEGRSVGIHMLLGSQRFGTVNMMHQSAIFGNIHMRIAMKLSLADRQALIEFGKEGKEYLANCDLPGKVVVNDQSGDDGYNKLGKVALIQKEDREKVILELLKKAHQQQIPDDLLTTNIFNGMEQPHIMDNTQLGFLLRHKRWMDKNEMEQFARKEIYYGGIGETSWFSGENPLVFWLGQEFNVRGHSNVVTRRRQRENVLIIGDNNDARYGIIFGILFSAVLNAPSTEIEFYIADKAIPNAPWSNALSALSSQLIQPMAYRHRFASKTDEILTTLAHLGEEIARRKAISEEERQQLPAIIFLASDLDRVDALNLQTNKFGVLEETEAGKTLRQVIMEGPHLGIHSFISFEGVMPMNNVFTKRTLEFFRHRVALQMSEQDAFDLVRRRDASRLQLHGNKPIAAFYLDIGSNKSSIFKPYVVSKGVSQEFISEIAKRSN